MTLAELMEKTGATRRQIYFMVAQGFMPSPEGPRSSPSYDEAHINAWHEYTMLRQSEDEGGLGLKPSQIKAIKKIFGERALKPEQNSFEERKIAPGIYLRIDKNRFGENTETMINTLRAALDAADFLEKE